MSRDPAMLIWLDSNSNVRGRPNENYARELMELFTLGVGHYTEADVREAARAFTGWHTDGRTFTFNRSQHDDGPKTVLGQTGPWDGGDVVRIVLDQPAAARFLVGKLYRALHQRGRAAPRRPARAAGRRATARRTTTSPTWWGRCSARATSSRRTPTGSGSRAPSSSSSGCSGPSKRRRPSPGYVRRAPRLMDGLGQTLFAPPNVKGWAGGEAWLNTATLLARHNLAWKVVQGARGPARVTVRPAGPGPHVRRPARRRGAGRLPARPAAPAGRGRGRRPGPLASSSSSWRRAAPRDAVRRRLRETIHAILLMPEYQLA